MKEAGNKPPSVFSRLNFSDMMRYRKQICLPEFSGNPAQHLIITKKFKFYIK